MSGVAIVRYLLANDAGVLAQVPAARIMAGGLPLDTVIPAIIVKQILGNDYHTIAVNDGFRTDRVEVEVLSDTYPKQKTIMGLIRAALPLSRGTVNGFNCDSVLSDLIGPDTFDQSTNIYSQTQDFVVKFIV